MATGQSAAAVSDWQDYQSGQSQTGWQDYDPKNPPQASPASGGAASSSAWQQDEGDTTGEGLKTAPFRVIQGAGKGLLNTVADASDVLHQAGNKIGETLDPFHPLKIGGRELGEAAAPHAGITAMHQIATPHDLMEDLGYGGEQAAEYILPGAGVEDATGRILTKLGTSGMRTLPRLATEFGVRSLGQGALNAGMTELQGGGAGDAALGAGLGAAGETVPLLRAGGAETLARLMTPSDARLAEKPIEALTRPAETMTRREALDWAHTHGIYPTAGEAGGARVPQFIQDVGETSLLKGEPLQRAREANVRALQDATNQFADSLDPYRRGLQPENAGMHLQDSAETARQVAKENERDAYSDLMKNVAPGSSVRVDLKPVRDQWRTELAGTKKVLPHLPPEEAKPMMQLLQYGSTLGTAANKSGLTGKEAKQAAIDAARGLDLDTAQKIRSFLWRSGTNSLLPTREQGMYRRMAHDVDDAIENSLSRASARGDIPADAFQRWKQAHQMSAEIHEDFGNRGVMGRILATGDPQKAAALVTGKQATPDMIRTLRVHNVDLGPVKRQVFENIRSNGFTLGRTPGIGGYSNGFLSQLFEPDELQTIYKMGQVARGIRYVPNPSGTAGTQGVREQLTTLDPRKLLMPATAAEATRISMRNPALSTGLPRNRLVRGGERLLLGSRSAERAAGSE